MFEQYNNVMTLRFSNADVQSIIKDYSALRNWLQNAADASNAVTGQGGSGVDGALVAGDDGFVRVSTNFAARMIMAYSDTNLTDASFDGSPSESLELHSPFEGWDSGNFEWNPNFNGQNLATGFDALATTITNSKDAVSSKGLSEYASGGTIALSSVSGVVFMDPEIIRDPVSGA